MSPVSRATTGGAAYLDLQRKARADGRTTEELIQLYIQEGFLARLAQSPHRDSFVLKGGVLLAVFDARRPTKDVDLAAVDIKNDVTRVLDLVRQVAAQPLDDGLVFDLATATATTIRDEDEYAGVRVTIAVGLATSKSRFQVDVNVGDPIWPRPQRIALPRILAGDPIMLAGYPLHVVLAEKLVTAVQRGAANTRWRDFADVWTLCHTQPVDGNDLQNAVTKVAEHRSVEISPLADLLETYSQVGQARWNIWWRKQRRSDLPDLFGEALKLVSAFADPALAGEVGDHRWDPSLQGWLQARRGAKA